MIVRLSTVSDYRIAVANVVTSTALILKFPSFDTSKQSFYISKQNSESEFSEKYFDCIIESPN
jgi:hypothetical protein